MARATTPAGEGEPTYITMRTKLACAAIAIVSFSNRCPDLGKRTEPNLRC